MPPIRSTAKNTQANSIQLGTWIVTTSPRPMPSDWSLAGHPVDGVAQLAIGDPAAAVVEHLAVGMRGGAFGEVLEEGLGRPSRPRRV